MSDTVLIPLNEWAKLRSITPAMARYYVYQRRIPAQLIVGRWFAPQDATVAAVRLGRPKKEKPA